MKATFPKYFFILFFILLFDFSFSKINAEPLSKTDVPESLRPWIDWVLKGEEEKLCPSLYGQED